MPAPPAIVSATPGGSGVPLGSRLVTSPVGTPPLRTFREVLYLRFAAGGLAEEIALDPAATVLRARFEPLEYDALHPGAPLAPANVRTVDGALAVELDAPRRLLFVRLAPQKSPEPDFTLSVHRLDGQAMAEKPTVTAGAVEWALAGLGNFLGAVGGGVAGKVGNASLNPSSRTFLFDFTDARFALRLRAPNGETVPLAAADVLAVQVRADLAGARIGIASPPLTDAAPAPFWPPPGDAAPAVEVDAGLALAEALERHLATLPAPSTSVEVALVITADSPCRLDLQALEVPYRLVRLSLGSGAGKEVVRFAGGGAADRPVILQLPGGATVVSATLEIMPSLRVDRPVSGGAEAASEPAEQTGVRVDGRAWVAQRVTPSQAVTVSGIAVGLLGLNRGAELTLELREDHQGEPTGRTLAEGSLTLEQAGRGLWSTVFLSAPVILPAQPCWLLLTAAGGGAVWLAHDLVHNGETTVRILDRSESPSGRQAGVQGLEALHRLLTVKNSQAETSGLELRLGGVAVAEMEGGDGERKSFDLAAALTSHLAGQPAAAPQDIPLVFTSAVPGSLTVYPPRITYEPAG